MDLIKRINLILQEEDKEPKSLLDQNIEGVKADIERLRKRLEFTEKEEDVAQIKLSISKLQTQLISLQAEQKDKTEKKEKKEGV